MKRIKLITLALSALILVSACEKAKKKPEEPPPVEVPEPVKLSGPGNAIPIEELCDIAEQPELPSYSGNGITTEQITRSNNNQNDIFIRWRIADDYSECKIPENSGYILEQRNRLLSGPAFADEDTGWEDISSDFTVPSDLKSGEYRLPRLNWYSEYQYRLRFSVSGIIESGNTEKLVLTTSPPPSPIVIEAQWDSAGGTDADVRWTERPSVYNDSNVSYHLRWRKKPFVVTSFTNEAWVDRHIGPPFSSESSSISYREGSDSNRIYFFMQEGEPGNDYEWQIRSCVDIEITDTTSNRGISESNPSCSSFVSVSLDDDDDGDGKRNLLDACRDGESGWTSDANTDKDGDGCRDAGEDMDDDNNGLIEIGSLEALANMQNNLAGTSYDDDEDDTGTDAADSTTSFDACGMDTTNGRGSVCGAPIARPAICKGRTTTTNLCGYELVGDLDFAVAGNYASGFVNTAWRPTDDEGNVVAPARATNAGFPGINADRTCFSGIFAGNNHAIHNLYMRTKSSHKDDSAGLFSCIAPTGSIRSVGLVNAHVYAYDNYGSGSFGSLVGRNDGTIIASYATGSGAMGRNTIGSINVVGNRLVFIGGLVGMNSADATIIASYSKIIVNGRAYHLDRVGGLVGRNDGSIIASYATGNVYSDRSGRNNDSSNAGGLVGYNHGGSITASYAMGNVYGEGGLLVGALVGQSDANALVTASYGFGDVDRVNSEGEADSYQEAHDGTGKPSGTSLASHLSLANADHANTDNKVWDRDRKKTQGVWLFGAHPPKLKYADYDGGGGTHYCRDVFPIALCNEEIAGQDFDLDNDGALDEDDSDVDGDNSPDTQEITCGTDPLDENSMPVDYDSDGHCNGVDTDDDDDGILDTDEIACGSDPLDENSMPVNTDGDKVCDAIERVCGSDPNNRRSLPADDDNDHVCDALDVDDDNDGLIEIRNLEMLNSIRYNTNGTSYRKDGFAYGDTRGAPTAGENAENAIANCGTARNHDDDAGTSEIYLCGYELTRDLNFATATDYASGTVNTDWCPDTNTNCNSNTATETGFLPIEANYGIFDGNNRAISNLYIRGNGDMGLFRTLDENGTIRNFGLVNPNIYTTVDTDDYSVGGLVGKSEGRIKASFVREGSVHVGGSGADGYVDGSVGGLVGKNEGSITASYATVAVHAGGGNDSVGGLVGYNVKSDSINITASYAKGVVNAGVGNDSVGGLVGKNEAKILASYATGDVNAGAGDDSAGGLVGTVEIRRAIFPEIIASYATGSVNGDGDDDGVGGLVGRVKDASDVRPLIDKTLIVASYATGNVNGGAGDEDKGDLLVGDHAEIATRSRFVIIIKSYAFGSISDVEDTSGGHDGDDKPEGATGASDLSSTNVGSSWNSESDRTSDVWQFGNAANPRHAPRLRYAEYDGTGRHSTRNYCDVVFPSEVHGQTIDCGTTLLSEQATPALDFTCENGNPVDTQTTDSLALENCASCPNSGYEEEEDIGSTGRKRCKPTYTCENGDRNTAITSK